MLSNPKVSLCMPAYNAGLYIAATIQSILNQSFGDFELIIVNDGSTDNTSAIVKSIKDERIKFYETDNRGQCAAANFAFRHSSGKFIKFLDADDLISKDFLNLQYENIKNSISNVASAEWGRFYNDDLNTFKLNHEEVWADLPSLEWLKKSLSSGHNMMQCAIWLIPREILNKSGLWDEKLSLINDFDFFIRVLLNSEKVKFTKGAVLYYRSGINSSLSNQKSRAAYLSAYNSIQKGLDYLLNKENTALTKQIASDIYKQWSFEFYPQEIDLYKQALISSKKYGNSKIKFPCGGYTKILVKFLGWKTTKRIKLLINK